VSIRPSAPDHAARTFDRSRFHDPLGRDRPAATPEGRSHRRGGAVLPEAIFRGRAAADDKKDDGPIGRREIVKGLDGMSRVADKGNSPFSGGHNAAAVISSAFFCREQKLDAEVQKEMLAVIEARLLKSPIYTARPEEKADPKLAEGLLEDLDAGIGTLRSSGHNIIVAVACLKALREVPEAATPGRVGGLRRMVQSFGTRGGAPMDKDPLADLGGERKFVHFVFEEYLKALDLYFDGKGHHGFAGHLLTIGHALVELNRMGHTELAKKGVPAYWQFVRQARAGADLGGKRVAGGPAQAPAPLAREYWVAQGKHHPGEIVSSHVVKYPSSFYALAKDLRDEELKKRIFDKVYHLTAIS
jgi:hypothetical protein